jgi:hypothetical protein
LSRIVANFSDDRKKVEELTAKAKIWKSKAQAIIEANYSEFSEWAGNLVATDGDHSRISAHNDKGTKVEMDKREAFQSSARALLHSLATESNVAILGDSKTKKNGAPKKTIFQKANRNASSTVESQGDDYSFFADVQHLATDRAGAMEKAVTLITKAAKYANNGQWSDAAECYLVLIGSLPAGSFSFGFDDEAIANLIQARIYGYLGVVARKWAQDIKKAIEEGKKAKILEQLEEKRQLDIKTALANATKSEEKAEKREAVEDKASVKLDTRATLPSPPPIKPITADDIAKRQEDRRKRQAEANANVA